MADATLKDAVREKYGQVSDQFDCYVARECIASNALAKAQFKIIADHYRADRCGDGLIDAAQRSNDFVSCLCGDNDLVFSA